MKHVRVFLAFLLLLPLAHALTVSNINRAGYTPAYIQVGQEYFTDRTSVLALEPVPEYRNLLWIKTANNDKQQAGDSFLTFTIDEPVYVYVAYDQRTPIPSWLTTWERRTNPIHLGQTNDVYVKSFPAGTVSLGGANSDQTNYLVLLRTSALPATPAAPVPTGYPLPQPNDYLLLDTRAGSSHDIQIATSVAQAQSYSGMSTSEQCDSGNCLGVEWSPNVVNNKKAFIWNIVQNAGNPAGCIQGGPSQHNWNIAKDMYGQGANGKTTYLQYKVWQGRTATGGGIGTIGSFLSGGKKFIWYRNPETGGRFTGAADPSISEHHIIFDPVTGQSGTGTGNDLRSTNGLDIMSTSLASPYSTPLSWNDYINQELTATYQFTTESAPGAGDGAFLWWVGNTLVMNVSNFKMGTLGWGWAQIGGPTWICPPQNQTAYYWDVLIWEKAPAVTQLPPTITLLSRDAGSIAGGTILNITGTNFVSGATATFGGTSASVTYVNSTALRITTPAHTTGTVNVVVTQNGQSATLTNGFEYLPAPTVTYISHDFEDGTVGGFTGSTSGSIQDLGTGNAVSGTKAFRGRVVGGQVGSAALNYNYGSPRQPPLATTGLYQRWYVRIDAATLAATSSGQIKLLLNRNKWDSGPGSWLHVGLGPDFPGTSGQVKVLLDYNTGSPPNGQGSTGFTPTADQWFEIQTHYIRGGGTARERMWINGKLVTNITDANFGSDNANDVLTWAFALDYTQGTAVTPFLTVYVDDAMAANGYIEPGSAPLPPPTGVCEATGNADCYYIDPVNGNDANAGTFAAPWRTFRPIAYYYTVGYRPTNWVQMQPGDYLYLMNGVYADSFCPGDCSDTNEGGPYVFNTRGYYGSPTAWYTLKAYPGHTPVIDPAAAVRGMRLYQGSYWNISGITIRDTYGTGLLIAEHNQVQVSDMHVYDVDGIDNNNIAGIGVYSVTNGEFWNLDLHDNFDRLAADTGGVATENSANMVIFEDGNITVRDSRFYHTRLGERIGTCLKYKHGVSRNKNWFVAYNNTFENCRIIGLATDSANSHIHHNTFRNGEGLRSADLGSSTTQAVNLLFEYNTLYNTTNGAPGLSPRQNPTAEFPNSPYNITYRNNIIYHIKSSYGSEDGIMNIGTYISDALYTATLPTLTINDNCYYNPFVSTNNLRFNFAAATNFGPLGANYDRAGWQNLGFDTRSVFTEPLFVNAAGGNFRTQAGSPCSAMGVYGTGSASPPTLRPGDLNNDGVVNINDVILIIQNFKRRGSYDTGADINNDGTVNIFDMVLLGRNWG